MQAYMQACVQAYMQTYMQAHMQAYMQAYLQAYLREEIHIPDPDQGLFLKSGFMTKVCKSVLCNYESPMQRTFDDIGGWPTDDKDLLITYYIALPATLLANQFTKCLPYCVGTML